MHAKTPSWASLIHLQRCKKITASTLPTRPVPVLPVRPICRTSRLSARVTALGQHGRVKITAAHLSITDHQTPFQVNKKGGKLPSFQGRLVEDLRRGRCRGHFSSFRLNHAAYRRGGRFNDCPISRAESTKSCATGLIVRFFKVMIPTGQGGTGSSTGTILNGGRFVLSLSTESGIVTKNSPFARRDSNR